MSWSQKFLEAFLAAYADARSLFSSEQWKTVWATNWNRFVLWNPLPPQPKSLLAMTAERMGLAYWDREPFRVDAAFVRPEFRVIGNLPMPLIVAIEHENDFRGFIEEIAKLTHIRCPLKVGITYSLLSTPPHDPDVSSARSQIESWIAEVDKLVHAKEDPENEYLYLLGVEQSLLTLEWHYYYRTAGSPSGGKWNVLAAQPAAGADRR